LNQLKPLNKLKSASQFWKELAGTVAIYDEVNNTRKRVSKEKTKPNKQQINIKNDVYDNDFQDGLVLILNVTENFNKLFKKIFIDMDNCQFKKTPSVNSSYDKELIAHNSRYELLKEVNLYNHTINVVIETIKLTNELPQNVRDIAIILALLHDFGKNDKIIKTYNLGDDGRKHHHRISAYYAKHTMQDAMIGSHSTNIITDELVEMIYKVLRMHHDSDKEKNLFLDLLIKADMNAREIELKGILLRKHIKTEHKERDNDS